MRGWEAPVFSERTSVGLDVHARSVAAAGLNTVTGQVWEHRLRPDRAAITAWLAELPGPGAGLDVAHDVWLRRLRAGQVWSAGTRAGFNAAYKTVVMTSARRTVSMP